jgi:hypothetical protein
LFDAYITNARVQEAIDNGNFAALAGFGAVSLDKIQSLHSIGVYEPLVGYVRDYVPVDKLRVVEE